MRQFHLRVMTSQDNCDLLSDYLSKLQDSLPSPILPPTEVPPYQTLVGKMHTQHMHLAPALLEHKTDDQYSVDIVNVISDYH